MYGRRRREGRRSEGQRTAGEVGQVRGWLRVDEGGRERTVEGKGRERGEEAVRD